MGFIRGPPQNLIPASLIPAKARYSDHVTGTGHCRVDRLCFNAPLVPEPLCRLCQCALIIQPLCRGDALAHDAKGTADQ